MGVKLFVVRVRGTAEMEGFLNFRDENLKIGMSTERVLTLVESERKRLGEREG